MRHFLMCFALCAALGLPLAAHSASTTTYDYKVYAGGLVAGTAEIQVTRNEDRYEIQGEAQATGIFKLISRWRTWLMVVGRTVAGQPVVETYEHVESKRTRVKEVKVADGVVLYVRDGEVREPTDAVAPVDLFSLIFVSGECEETLRAHTGRMGFDLRLVNWDLDRYGERCDYSIVDDDADNYDAQVWIKEVDGIRAPSRIKIDGYVRGTFQLEKVARVDPIPAPSEFDETTEESSVVSSP